MITLLIVLVALIVLGVLVSAAGYWCGHGGFIGFLMYWQMCQCIMDVLLVVVRMVAETNKD